MHAPCLAGRVRLTLGSPFMGSSHVTKEPTDLDPLRGSGSEQGCSCDPARLLHLQQTLTVALCLLLLL